MYAIIIAMEMDYAWKVVPAIVMTDLKEIIVYIELSMIIDEFFY